MVRKGLANSNMNEHTFYEGNMTCVWIHFKMVISREMDDENQAG